MAARAASSLTSERLERIARRHEDGDRLTIALPGSAARPESTWNLGVISASRHPDAASTVISAGFGGIALGSTATAVANMTTVTQQYGAAHRAFIIVPLVCGFFIDIINTLVIAGFIGLKP